MNKIYTKQDSIDNEMAHLYIEYSAEKQYIWQGTVHVDFLDELGRYNDEKFKDGELVKITPP